MSLFLDKQISKIEMDLLLNEKSCAIDKTMLGLLAKNKYFHL